MFTITLLGTSDAVGTPVHGCACARCQDALAHPWLRRLPTCVLIQNERASVLVDMGANDHIHSLRSVNLDAVFVTHFHMDHIAGLYTLRWTQQAGGLPVYYPQGAEGDGDGASLLADPVSLQPRPLPPFIPVEIAGFRVTPVPLQHPRLTHGYVIEHRGVSAAFLFDTSGLPAPTATWLAERPPAVALVDSCYAPGEHTEGHNGVDEALAIIAQIGARQGVLTHIAHHNWRYRDLVAYVRDRDGGRSTVAYDGLRFGL